MCQDRYPPPRVLGPPAGAPAALPTRCPSSHGRGSPRTCLYRNRTALLAWFSVEADTRFTTARWVRNTSLRRPDDGCAYCCDAIRSARSIVRFFGTDAVVLPPDRTPADGVVRHPYGSPKVYLPVGFRGYYNLPKCLSWVKAIVCLPSIQPLDAEEKHLLSVLPKQDQPRRTRRLRKRRRSTPSAAAHGWASKSRKAEAANRRYAHRPKGEADKPMGFHQTPIENDHARKRRAICTQPKL